MGFKDDLINEIQQEKEQERMKEEQGKLPIPNDELDRLANEMATLMKNRLKDYVKSGFVQYDYGGFRNKKKVNFRYKADEKWVFSQTTKLLDKEPWRWSERLLLPKSIYFDMTEQNWGPDILIGNIAHLDQLINAVKPILEKDGCVVTYRKGGKDQYGRTEIYYEAAIRCKENGDII